MKLNIQLFAETSLIITTEMDTSKAEKEWERFQALVKQSERDKFWAEHFDDIELPTEEIKEAKEDAEEFGEELDDIPTKTTKIKFSLDGVLSKIGKWALAIFSIRSAYNFVRNSINMLSQSNKQLASDIEYMRWALAQSIGKVIVKIVSWAYKLLQIINYLVYGITGINLFANASADAFKRQKDAMSGTTKSAKELKKTLAGFDEMNIVQDTGATSIGGGGGGISFPTEDLSKVAELGGKLKETLDKIIDVLKPLYEKYVEPFIKDIIEHPEKIVKFIAVIEALKLGTKILGIASGLSLVKDVFVGLGNLIGPIIRKVATKIGTLITKIGGPNAGLIGALALLDVILIDHIVKDVKNKLIPLMKETNERLDETTNLVKGRESATDKATNAILENAKAENGNTEATKNHINMMLKSIESNDKYNQQLEQENSKMFQVRKEKEKNIEVIKQNNNETYKYLKTLGELYQLQKLTPDQVKLYSKALQDEITRLEEANKKLNKNSDEYKENSSKIQALKNDLNNLPKTVTSTVTVKGDTSGARSKIEDFLKDVQSAGIAGALGISNIANAIKKIKYAKGGIINMPGKGVPLTQHIGGEAGREGIIPLTDSQQMELLGEAIGRYITINANITNTMNGRVISKELQKIQQENSFASNR